jgi:hypothetical protein
MRGVDSFIRGGATFGGIPTPLWITRMGAERSALYLLVAGEFGQVDFVHSTFNRLLPAPDCIVVERHRPSEPGLATFARSCMAAPQLVIP